MKKSLWVIGMTCLGMIALLNSIDTRLWLRSLVVPKSNVAPLRTSLPAQAQQKASISSDDNTQVYIIRLADVPLAIFAADLARTSAKTNVHQGRINLDRSIPSNREYLQSLDSQQAAFISELHQVAASAEIIYAYTVTLNGLAVAMNAADAARVAEMSDVVAMHADEWYALATDVTPGLIGAEQVWNGSETVSPSRGEGVIVGIIDTGIWPEHPSFTDDGSYPNPPAEWTGTCVPPADNSLTYTCNNKVIGIQFFLDGYKFVVGSYNGLFESGRDESGHGSMVASIAVGNENVPVILNGINRDPISGIAPRAHLAVYKTVGPNGSRSSDLIAAIDAAVADGVDIINMSLAGSFAANPWDDDISLAFLAATEAGVFVTVSAGNVRFDDNTVGSPANAPWVTTVGATTSNRHFLGSAVVSGPGTPLPAIVGSTIAGSFPANARLVSARGIANIDGGTEGLCDKEFVGKTFQSNDIVLCHYSYLLGIRQSGYLRAGGAGGVIFYSDPLETFTTLNYHIPGMQINNDDGMKLQQLLAANPNQFTVEITASKSVTFTDFFQADTMASFSARGPVDTVFGNQLQRDWAIKPDITAPGVQVLSATSPHTFSQGNHGELFQAFSGTSAASPHIAGVAALYLDLHPDATPDQVRSALMTSAETTVYKEDRTTIADPFDTGAGRVDAFNAVQTGLVLNESAANYRNANPFDGGDPTTLNLPSLINGNCEDVCVWNRTLVNTSDVTLTLRISPTNELQWEVNLSRLVVPPQGSTTLEVRLDADSTTFLEVLDNPTSGRWYMDEIAIADEQKAIPDVNLTVAASQDVSIYLPLVTK